MSAVLLVNVGSPSSLSLPNIRHYLKTFLNDKRIIDLPQPLRWLLVNAIIVPTRACRSQQAYQKIWTKQGSPLQVNMKKLVDSLAHKLQGYEVEYAMNYGKPLLVDRISYLTTKHRKVIVIPLYPQYAAATTGSTLDTVYRHISNFWNVSPINIVSPFFNNKTYIIDMVSSIKIHRQKVGEWEHLLFSYHGLPETHVQHSCAYFKTTCKSSSCQQNPNHFCYRQQCFSTTKLIANELGLTEKEYSISFQSRLGRKRWLHPYTDKVLKNLWAQGIRKLAVITPSFIVDCLETLEEIDISLRAQWLSMGGEFTFISCLNEKAANCLANIVDSNISGL